MLNESFSVLTFCLTKFVDRLGKMALSSLGCLGLLDWQRVEALLAVGQLIEKFLGFWIARESFAQFRRHGYLARRGIQLDINIHHVSTRDSGGLAHVGA